jgi:outer membrane lipoprotein-sorting protein
MRLLCTLLLFAASFSSAQSIDKISAQFIRTTQRGNAALERTEGNVYLDAKGTIWIRVLRPVDQWVIVDKNTMLLYYPKEQKAFRFTRSSPFTLPLYQSFFALSDDPADLSRYGFALTGNQMNRDTLITSWTGPGKTSEGDVVNVALSKDRLAYIEVLDVKGMLKNKTTYSDYFKNGRRAFPLRINSMQQLSDTRIEDRMEYSSLQFNEPFPKEVTSFSIPSTVIVSDIQW